MIDDVEFVREMLKRIGEKYPSKRQFTLELGLKNAQTLNYWVIRDRVLGDYKIKVAELLDMKYVVSRKKAIFPRQLIEKL